MSKPKLLITCPPMIQAIYRGEPTLLAALDPYNYHCPQFQQTMTVEELKELVPQYNYWIIGDDPANYDVVAAGAAGKLEYAVKWGVGVDNVDFSAFEQHNILVTNTPCVFGEEVSDVALGYLLMLSRHLHTINQGVWRGGWPKPAGDSLTTKKITVIGYGDIGQATVRKLAAFKPANLSVFDPAYVTTSLEGVEFTQTLEQAVRNANYLVVCCSLNSHTNQMVNRELLSLCASGVQLINVSRGQIVNESDLVDLLNEGHVKAVALDVFEQEPLSMNSELMKFDHCVFGTHNGSNSKQAVLRVSLLALEKIKHKAKHA